MVLTMLRIKLLTQVQCLVWDQSWQEWSLRYSLHYHPKDWTWTLWPDLEALLTMSDPTWQFISQIPKRIKELPLVQETLNLVQDGQEDFRTSISLSILTTFRTTTIIILDLLLTWMDQGGFLGNLLLFFRILFSRFQGELSWEDFLSKWLRETFRTSSVWTRESLSPKTLSESLSMTTFKRLEEQLWGLAMKPNYRLPWLWTASSWPAEE